MAAPLLLALLLLGPQAEPPTPDSDEDGAPVSAAQSANPPVGQTVGQPLGQTPGQPPAEAAPGEDPTQAQPMDPLTPRAPVVRPFEMPVSYMPGGPMIYDAKPQVKPVSAVTVDKYEGSYEGPADSEQRYYESGIESHFQAEQSMMGALDGEWTISGSDGAKLFTVILNDLGSLSPIEGAWRDLRPGHPGGIGLVDSAQHINATLTVSFHAGDGDRLEPTVLKLTSQPGGQWRGELDVEGARQTVIMSRASTPPPPS